jgi:DNA repair protein RadC
MPEATRIKDLPDSEKPRERLLAKGAEALKDSELIAILLRTGTQGLSAIDVAQSLLNKFGSLDALAKAPIEELCVKGVGRDKAVTLKSAFSLAKRLADELRHESPVLDTPEKLASLLREDNRLLEVEHFTVVLVNTKRRLIRVETLARGTLDSLVTHPRDVFRPAIAANASAVFLAHNHPSGDPTPSEADIKFTRDIIRAGKLLKIDVLDHIILGRRTAEREKDYVSLRELGYFYA